MGRRQGGTTLNVGRLAYALRRKEGTMPLGLLEAAVDALDTCLEAGIAAKLDELDTEYGDLALDDIKAWHLGALPTAIPIQPTVVIWGGGWEPKNQRGVNLHVVSRLQVIVFVGQADVAERFRRLCRYARAVVELMQEGEDSTGYTIWIDGKVEISESLSTPEFLQAIAIPVAMERLETY